MRREQKVRVAVAFEERWGDEAGAESSPLGRQGRGKQGEMARCECGRVAERSLQGEMRREQRVAYMGD